MTKFLPIALASLVLAGPVFAETLSTPGADAARGKILLDAAGSRLGSAIDRNILHNLHCRACGHRFSNKSS